jgi:predicted YcjX-like family ATPase
MEFKKAIKRRQRLRLAIDGVSGSGKTYTALAIASGIGGKIAVIDTEHGSASLYADRFDFDTLELERFQIEDYIEALQSAAAGNKATGRFTLSLPRYRV